MLKLKYSSTVMQGKRKLSECHTRFFFQFEFNNCKAYAYSGHCNSLAIMMCWNFYWVKGVFVHENKRI